MPPPRSRRRALSSAGGGGGASRGGGGGRGGRGGGGRTSLNNVNGHARSFLRSLQDLEKASAAGGDDDNVSGDSDASLDDDSEESDLPEHLRGVVNSSDDEDIDDEEAFASSDDEKFGHIKFNTGKNPSTSQRAGSRQDDSDDDDENSSEEEDYDDDSEDDDDDDDDDDGGEMPLDGGAGWLHDGDDEEDDDDDDEEEEEEEEEDADAARRLARSITSTATPVPTKANMMPVRTLGTTSKLGDGVLAAFDDETDEGARLAAKLSGAPRGVARKLARASADAEAATAAPLPKVAKERAERQAGYALATVEASKWVGAVTAHRKAASIRFPDARDNAAARAAAATTNALAADYVADDDMEREMAAQLQAAMGAERKAELAALSRGELGGLPEDDKEGRKAAARLEEARIAQLSRLRTLLFKDELKAKRLRKIKSKAHHRRLNRSERFKKLREGADDAEERAEIDAEESRRLELERLKERVTLRHSNSGQWARRLAKKKGLRISGGPEAAKAVKRMLGEQMTLGEKLRSRQEENDDEDDDDDDDDMGDEDDGTWIFFVFCSKYRCIKSRDSEARIHFLPMPLVSRLAPAE